MHLGKTKGEYEEKKGKVENYEAKNYPHVAKGSDQFTDFLNGYNKGTYHIFSGVFKILGTRS